MKRLMTALNHNVYEEQLRGSEENLSVLSSFLRVLCGLKRSRIHLIALIISYLLIALPGSGVSLIDLSQAKIVFPALNRTGMSGVQNVLQQEIEKRTGIRLAISSTFPATKQPVIGLALENDLPTLALPIQQAARKLPTIKAEGFKLLTIDVNTVIVVGKDPRGLLYGIGRLLRKLDMRPGQIHLLQLLNLSDSPQYPIRGHQLGYRPKTNAYDAFTVAQFDQYIRDLALFGANSIEIMPPRTDDDFSSPHMKLPAIKMIGEQSRICQQYGLDVWMWYPNMGLNYTHPDSIQRELAERREVFAAVPKLDALFVPGGDPGDLEPDVLFSWLNKVAAVLHTYHPKAKIWVSPQVFKPSQQWFDAFYAHINRGYPWLGGVVFGPWVKTPVQEIRKLVKPSIPIRHYPDITHSLSSQYPIPDWDLAYAMTLGRECINPRPNDQKTIHNAFDQFGAGSISYSEGTNDDVNKFIWSDQDWNPNTPVIETLRDYARLFIGPDYAESVAQGLLALERNLQGPLLVNQQVERTLQQWQTLEKQASISVLQNPRFQMPLLRAYYDAYVRRRLIHETELEVQARELLRTAQPGKVAEALRAAREVLQKGQSLPVSLDLRTRCFALADSLYSSIGAQLTMKRHGASDGRGNFLDNIDIPLNDAPWLLDQIASIEKTPTESEQLVLIHAMLHRTDPGPGGFYDHFGNYESRKKVVSPKRWAEDPGGLQSPSLGFGVGLKGDEWVHEIRATGFEGQATPLAWMSQVNTLYDQPLQIAYNDLDPTASYRLRVAYTGAFRSKMKLMVDHNLLIHDFIQTGDQPIYEFTIPKAALADGKLLFTWTCGEGERGSQVTEIWIIKN